MPTLMKRSDIMREFGCSDYRLRQLLKTRTLQPEPVPWSKIRVFAREKVKKALRIEE